MELTTYNVSLVAGGTILFLLLMRLFSSSWGEVGECFIYLFKPQWLSVLTGDFHEDTYKTMKLFGVALMAAYLTLVFHWKLGDWWLGVLT